MPGSGESRPSGMGLVLRCGAEVNMTSREHGVLELVFDCGTHGVFTKEEKYCLLEKGHAKGLQVTDGFNPVPLALEKEEPSREDHAKEGTGRPPEEDAQGNG